MLVVVEVVKAEVVSGMWVVDVALIAVGVVVLQAWSWSEMVARLLGPVATAAGGIIEKEVPLYCKMAFEVPRIGCWSEA